MILWFVCFFFLLIFKKNTRGTRRRFRLRCLGASPIWIYIQQISARANGKKIRNFYSDGPMMGPCLTVTPFLSPQGSHLSCADSDSGLYSPNTPIESKTPRPIHSEKPPSTTELFHGWQRVQVGPALSEHAQPEFLNNLKEYGVCVPIFPVFSLKN